MICLNCGKAIDDDLKVCPFCGSLTDAYAETGSADLPDADPAGAPADPDDGQDYFDENPVYPEARNAAKPLNLPGSMTSLLVAAVACVLSLACLVSILSLRSAIREQNRVLTGSVSEVRNAVNAVNDRLYELDDTLSRVQAEAYNQLASQSIAITKDITPLTGPVEADKYNRMFIVNAKGNLSVREQLRPEREHLYLHPLGKRHQARGERHLPLRHHRRHRHHQNQRRSHGLRVLRHTAKRDRERVGLTA